METLKRVKTEADGFELYFFMLKKEDIFYFRGILSKDGKEIESCTTPAITDDVDMANTIFNVFVEEKVFPAHFYYVIDELV